MIHLQKLNLSLHGEPVLRDIDLAIAAGQVHALTGRHGEGKSWLGRILCGQLSPTSGTIQVDGTSYASLKHQDALRFGIELVPQQIELFDRLSVAENLLICDTGIGRGFFVRPGQQRREASRIINDYGFTISSGQSAGELPTSERTVLLILRCLYRQPRLLILDETLSKLDPSHQRLIIRALLTAKEQGMAILWITHDIDAISDFADCLTILRKGQVVLSDNVGNIDRTNLIKLCYNQVTKGEAPGATYQEFYNLLKYNEAILRKLPVNLLVLDAEGRLRLINQPAQAFFDDAPERFFNNHIQEIFKGTSTEAIQLVQDALDAHREQTFYDVSLRVSQRDIVATVTVFPILDGPTPIGTILIVEDCTEQTRMRQQVILSEKLASVGLLAAGVAHEINNPLEIIHNYLSFLRLKTVDNALDQTIDDLEEEVDHIGQIVSNLVSFARRSPQSTDHFDLVDTMRDLIRLIRFNADFNKSEIHLQCDVEQVLFSGNRNELKQVFLNLIRNSFEAMPDGGRIDLTLTTEASSAVIRHRDHGPGIQLTNANDVFLPFYSTKQARGSNLGLGLAIVHGIITNHGGTISVTNHPEAGCEFEIRLPLSSDMG